MRGPWRRCWTSAKTSTSAECKPCTFSPHVPDMEASICMKGYTHSRLLQHGRSSEWRLPSGSPTKVSAPLGENE